ncbi:MAG TPA: PIG-L family deacetylase, partial [Kiritimatiellia bacterium]|nr:PIG-L family deacetylase [Kiritimatiellia bacterium]
MSAVSNPYQAIYLSPHLDDAVLSCGGQLAARVRRGERVLVATLAAGDPVRPLPPLARALHAEWKLDDSCEARREEDRRACGRLGAEVFHVVLPDAMYRRHPATGEPLYPDLGAVFGRPARNPPGAAGQRQPLPPPRPARPPPGNSPPPAVRTAHPPWQNRRTEPIAWAAAPRVPAQCPRGSRPRPACPPPRPRRGPPDRPALHSECLNSSGPPRRPA